MAAPPPAAPTPAFPSEPVPAVAEVPVPPEPAPEPASDSRADQPLPPPPFGPGAAGRRPRRNPARRWTMFAIAFALAVAAAAGAIAAFGLPAWASNLLVIRPADEPDLVIELPVEAQDHRELPNGTIYFAANGSIINPTDQPQRVPPIKAELRDSRGDIVYEWIITPPVDVLPPGERVSFSEARTDIPRRAVLLTASWAIPR